MSAVHPPHAARATHGQTLVLFALMSLLLIAGLGLIIDAGYDYSQRRLMQNAADAAALRGARVIAQRGNSANPYVLQEVQESAVSNGVENATFVECHYIDADREVFPDPVNESNSACQNNVAIPVGASGVRVKVRETHTTFFMRAVGVTTSGTAATAAAQVRVLTEMQSIDVPFAVCGMNAAQVGGGEFDILQTEIFPAPSPPTPWIDAEGVVGVGEFNSGIFSYDWSDPNADGTLKLISAAPAPFLIYGDGIGDCSLNGWKGLLDHDTGGVEVLLLDHSQTDEYAAVVTLREGESDGVGGSGENRLDPERTIDGVRGCRPNVEPDDCVLILPIVFNNADCEFCTPYSEPYQFAANGSVTLYFARWGAFLMNAESGGAYSGRMIKNYPLQATGKNQWHRNWQEPITINLVKLP